MIRLIDVSFMCSVSPTHRWLSKCSVEFRKTILLNMYFIINYFTEVVNWKLSQQQRLLNSRLTFKLSLFNVECKWQTQWSRTQYTCIENIFRFRISWGNFVSAYQESQSIVNLWKQLKWWKVLVILAKHQIWNDNGSMKLNLITIHCRTEEKSTK